MFTGLDDAKVGVCFGLCAFPRTDLIFQDLRFLLKERTPSFSTRNVKSIAESCRMQCVNRKCPHALNIISTFIYSLLFEGHLALSPVP